MEPRSPETESQRTPEELADLAGGRDVTLRFVRHGQTVFNSEHRMQGWSDSPMTELGNEQIAQVAKRLAPVPFDLAFTSDLQRCVTTCEGILAARTDGLTATPLEDLREWNFGAHEERPSAEVWGKLIAQHRSEVVNEREAIAELAEELGWTGMFDGIAALDESGRSEFARQIVVRADRALATVLTAAAEHPGAGPVEVLVVTHGGLISTLLRQIDPNDAPPVIHPNCSVSTAALRDGVWQIVAQGVPSDEFEYAA